jgi:hypothetical protein
MAMLVPLSNIWSSLLARLEPSGLTYNQGAAMVTPADASMQLPVIAVLSNLHHTP